MTSGVGPEWGPRSEVRAGAGAGAGQAERAVRSTFAPSGVEVRRRCILYCPMRPRRRPFRWGRGRACASVYGGYSVSWSMISSPTLFREDLAAPGPW